MICENLTRFGAPIKYEYDDGYLLIGGSLFCKNLDAIVTRAKVCRNTIMHGDVEIVSYYNLEFFFVNSGGLEYRLVI